MAAVHSVENPPTGLLGAYKCLICRFCSPLYSELIRHFNEYHSRSGWLLCPLCLRVFRASWKFRNISNKLIFSVQFNLLLEIIFNLQKSSDTHYEQHLAQHIQQGKWFRCQSCRLVFETETSRNRHELEMHGRQKWTVPEAHPKVPTNVKGFYSFPLSVFTTRWIFVRKFQVGFWFISLTYFREPASYKIFWLTKISFKNPTFNLPDYIVVITPWRKSWLWNNYYLLLFMVHKLWLWKFIFVDKKINFF